MQNTRQAVYEGIKRRRLLEETVLDTRAAFSLYNMGDSHHQANVRKPGQSRKPLPT